MIGDLPTLGRACSLNYGTSLQATGPAADGSRAQCRGGNACSAVCARYDRRHGHCRERTYGGEQRTSLLLVAACLHQPGLALCVCAPSLTCEDAQTCNSTWI